MQIDIILAPLSLCLSTQEISRVSFSFTQTDSFIHSFMQQMFIDLLTLCQILWRTWSTLLQIIVCGNFSIRSQDHSKKRMKEGKKREGREKEGKLSKKRRRCTDMNDKDFTFLCSAQHRVWHTFLPVVPQLCWDFSILRHFWSSDVVRKEERT